VAAAERPVDPDARLGAKELLCATFLLATVFGQAVVGRIEIDLGGPQGASDRAGLGPGIVEAVDRVVDCRHPPGLAAAQSPPAQAGAPLPLEVGRSIAGALMLRPMSRKRQHQPDACVAAAIAYPSVPPLLPQHCMRERRAAGYRIKKDDHETS